MLVFETIKTNIGDTVQRAAVPGGWLVLVTSDVVHFTETMGTLMNHDWRTSTAFVPDAEHTWRIEE